MKDDDVVPRTEEEVDRGPSKDEKKAEKKKLKKLEESLETGSLDPWERYRVMSDILDHYQDVAEMADRKSRFALVVLGTLNALNWLVLARPDLLSTLNGGQAWIAIYVVGYVGISLYLFVQAIGTLKPRISSVLSTVQTPEQSSRKILGLRFASNILEAGFEEYYEKWRQAPFADINRELALHIRTLAAIVASKYATLHRLYIGLLVLVTLTAALITVLVLNHLTTSAQLT